MTCNYPVELKTPVGFPFLYQRYVVDAAEKMQDFIEKLVPLSHRCWDDGAE